MKPSEIMLDSEFVQAPKKHRNEDIKIFSSIGDEWEILSYYYSPEEKCMVLDIQKKE